MRLCDLFWVKFYQRQELSRWWLTIQYSDSVPEYFYLQMWTQRARKLTLRLLEKRNYFVLSLKFSLLAILPAVGWLMQSIIHQISKRGFRDELIICLTILKKCVEFPHPNASATIALHFPSVQLSLPHSKCCHFLQQIHLRPLLFNSQWHDERSMSFFFSINSFPQISSLASARFASIFTLSCLVHISWSGPSVSACPFPYV